MPLAIMLDDRIAFVASDLFGGFSPSSASFDVIISNPPYIGEKEFPLLAAGNNTIRTEHRPSWLVPKGLRLFGGLWERPELFEKEGSLLMEIGAGQAEILHEELSQEPLIDHFEFIQDYSGVLARLAYSQSTFLRGEKWTNW